MVRYKITTPELVDFHYEIAGLVSRSLACLLDQCLLFAFILMSSFFATSLGPFIGDSFATAVFFLLMFLLQFGYFAFFEMKTGGQSPGKKVFRLRVISTTGGRLTFSDVLLRGVSRAVDFLPFGYLLGLLIAFFDPYRRRLGDIAAGTIVVRDAKRELGTLPAAQRLRANTFQTDAAIRGRILMRVTRAERDLILDLMLRRDELDPLTRDELFRDTAEFLRERYSLPVDLDYLSDEQTVLNVALVLESDDFRKTPGNVPV